jgi:carboxymethylenebutenolidase
VSGRVAVLPSPDGVPGAVTDPDALEAQEIVFPGADRDGVGGYLVRPAAPGEHPGMIVIHEAGGLGDHIRDVSNRIAALGYVVLAVNMYTREGGPPDTSDMQQMLARLF